MNKNRSIRNNILLIILKHQLFIAKKFKKINEILHSLVISIKKISDNLVANQNLTIKFLLFLIN